MGHHKQSRRYRKQKAIAKKCCSLLDYGTYVVQFNESLSKLYHQNNQTNTTPNTHSLVSYAGAKKVNNSTTQHQRPQNNRFTFFYLSFFAWMWTNSSSCDTSALSSSFCLANFHEGEKYNDFDFIHTLMQLLCQTFPTIQANCYGKELHDSYTKSQFYEYSHCYTFQCENKENSVQIWLVGRDIGYIWLELGMRMKWKEREREMIGFSYSIQINVNVSKFRAINYDKYVVVYPFCGMCVCACYISFGAKMSPTYVTAIESGLLSIFGLAAAKLVFSFFLSVHFKMMKM